jgi:photosystem II stability/assembly factor-like uncharacterized protein
MKWGSLIFLILFLSSCQNESIALDLIELDSQTNEGIYDLVFVDENTAYYCGGSLWNAGVVGKSTDGGQTWEVVLEADNILFAVAFKNENEGVALGFSGRVWRTKNGGLTWNLTESAPNYPTFSDAQFVTENRLMVSAGFNYYSGGFARYLFNGQSFGDSLINQDMQALHFFDEQEGIMAGYGALFRTVDGGKQWTPNSVKGDYFKDLDFNDKGEGLLIGYQGKVFDTSDKGLNWEKNAKKSSFFSTKGNLESTAISDAKAFIAGQNGNLNYSNNFMSGSWVRVETPYGNDFLKILLTSPSEGYLAGSDGLLLKFFY